MKVMEARRRRKPSVALEGRRWGSGGSKWVNSAVGEADGIYMDSVGLDGAGQSGADGSVGLDRAGGAPGPDRS